MPRPRFAVDDILQQMVGGFLLAGPFVVTEEVWTLAGNMTPFHVAGTVLLALGIGYGALFYADREREMDEEDEIAGIPVRFLSLIGVAYGSVILLILLLAAPSTFQGSLTVDLYNVGRVTAIAAIFSVVGAATADSVF